MIVIVKIKNMKTLKGTPFTTSFVDGSQARNRYKLIEISMKRIIFILSVIISIVSCETQNKEIISLNAEDFASMLINTEDIQVLDVRTHNEFIKGHIQNAINIDINENGFIDEVNNQLLKENPVAIYCKTGKRSKTAATILNDMGYTVYELKQGLIEWKGAMKTN